MQMNKMAFIALGALWGLWAFQRLLLSGVWGFQGL
jgi:hypothetical protein